MVLATPSPGRGLQPLGWRSGRVPALAPAPWTWEPGLAISYGDVFGTCTRRGGLNVVRCIPAVSPTCPADNWSKHQGFRLCLFGL